MSFASVVFASAFAGLGREGGSLVIKCRVNTKDDSRQRYVMPNCWVFVLSAYMWPNIKPFQAQETGTISSPAGLEQDPSGLEFRASGFGLKVSGLGEP